MAAQDPFTSEEELIHKDGDIPSKKWFEYQRIKTDLGRSDEVHKYICKNDPHYECAVKVKHIIMLKGRKPL